MGTHASEYLHMTQLTPRTHARTHARTHTHKKSYNANLHHLQTHKDKAFHMTSLSKALLKSH